MSTAKKVYVVVGGLHIKNAKGDREFLPHGAQVKMTKEKYEQHRLRLRPLNEVKASNESIKEEDLKTEEQLAAEKSLKDAEEQIQADAKKIEDTEKLLKEAQEALKAEQAKSKELEEAAKPKK